jgi:hypothetical protein
MEEFEILVDVWQVLIDISGCFLCFSGSGWYPDNGMFDFGCDEKT